MDREQAWIAAARRGDQTAFEELVRLYEKRVLALTLRMCKNPQDAAEAAHNILYTFEGLRVLALTSLVTTEMVDREIAYIMGVLGMVVKKH